MKFKYRRNQKFENNINLGEIAIQVKNFDDFDSMLLSSLVLMQCLKLLVLRKKIF